MHNILFIFATFACHFLGLANNIYSKAFGDPNATPIIFLHGGPGYNSASFEFTTAQKLSESGFYVIIYDRRGEGRSIDKKAKFTFRQSFDDLNLIYKKYKLNSAILLGHSFGGIIASLFTEKYPNKVKTLILMSTPLALQETFSTIIKSSKEKYIEKNDSINLAYIKMLEEMDTSSLEFSAYCFTHAMNSGLYYPKKITQSALSIYEKFKTDSILLKYSSTMTYEATTGFWENEKYTTMNIEKNLQKLVRSGIRVFALYGKEDGLFCQSQIQTMQNVIHVDNLNYFSNCGHNLFIDQQNQFINALRAWIQ